MNRREFLRGIGAAVLLMQTVPPAQWPAAAIDTGDRIRILPPNEWVDLPEAGISVFWNSAFLITIVPSEPILTPGRWEIDIHDGAVDA